MQSRKNTQRRSWSAGAGTAVIAHRFPRLDHARDIPPGATLYLYTGGLVGHRPGHDIDEGTNDVVHLLRRIRHQPTLDIVDTRVDNALADPAVTRRE